MTHKLIATGVFLCLTSLSLSATAQETFNSDQDLQNATHASDGFGFAIAQDRNLLAVGIPYAVNPVHTMMPYPTGGAIIYEKSNGNWAQKAVVLLPRSEMGVDRCGSSIAVHNGRQNNAEDVIVIGCPGFSPNVGAAYVMTHSGNHDWRITERLNKPATLPDDGFGEYVAVAGKSAVVGFYGGLFSYNLTLPSSSFRQNSASAPMYSANAEIVSFAAKGPWIAAGVFENQFESKVFTFQHIPGTGMDWKRGTYTLPANDDPFVSVEPQGINGATVAVVATKQNVSSKLHVLNVDKDARVIQVASGNIKYHGAANNLFNYNAVANIPNLVAVQTTMVDDIGNPAGQRLGVYQVQNNTITEVADYIPENGTFFSPGMVLNADQFFIGRDKFGTGAVMIKATGTLSTTTNEARVVISLTNPSIAENGTHTTTAARPNNFEGTCKTSSGAACSDVTLTTSPNDRARLVKKGSAGDFEIEFSSDLQANQPVQFTLRGQAPNTPGKSYTFSVVYDPQAPPTEAPQIDAPSDSAAFDIEETQSIVLNFTLDPNVDSKLDLLHRPIDSSDDWNNFASVSDARGNYTWATGKTWEQGSYELIATTQDQVTSVFFSIYDTPTILVDGLEYSEDTPPTVGLTFTLDGQSGTEEGNIAIKQGGKVIKQFTANDQGEWSESITVSQTGDIELEIEVTTIEGLLVEYEDDLKLSVINDPGCTAEDCVTPPMDRAPEKLDTGLCTSTDLPHTPTSGAGLLLLLLGWVGWRRRALVK